MITEIPLTQGYVALVDDDDAERVLQFKWYAEKRSNTIYARTDGRGSGTRKYLHGFILQVHPPLRVDHVDGYGLNCQRLNLRQATQSQNLQNSKKKTSSSSPFKGVTFRKGSRRWMSQIHSSGKTIFLGYFDDPEAAAERYDAAARQLFGEFCRVNFPTEGERAA